MHFMLSFWVGWSGKGRENEAKEMVQSCQHDSSSFSYTYLLRKYLNTIGVVPFKIRVHLWLRFTSTSVALIPEIKWYYSIKLMFTNWYIYSSTQHTHTHIKITEHNVSNNFSIPMHTYGHRHRHRLILLSSFGSCCRQSITCSFACVCDCNGIYRTYGVLWIFAWKCLSSTKRHFNNVFCCFFVEITQKNERRRQRSKIWIQFYSIFFVESAWNACIQNHT